MMCELVQLDAAAVRDAVKANLDMKKHFKRLCVGYAAILTQEELELVRFLTGCSNSITVAALQLL